MIPEIQALRSQIEAFSNKVSTLEEVVENLSLQLENRNSVIIRKDSQIVEYEAMKEDLEKEVKRLSRIGKIYKIGSAIGVAAILLNILGK